jgi:peptidoglycan biosynthesis protein MviN/MurJ (putative lipid II flippase)
MRTGTGVWAAGLLSMLMLLVVAGAVAARRVPRLAAKVALVSIATAAVTGALFVIQFPGVQGAEMDRGIALFGAAIALGAAACIAVLRAKR